MLLVADFFSIPTHILIKSHLRDGSCHLDCCRASFYKRRFAIREGKALVQRARGRLRASRSLREIGGMRFVNQGGRLMARVFPSRRLSHLTANMTAKSWSAPENPVDYSLRIHCKRVRAYLLSTRQAVTLPCFPWALQGFGCFIKGYVTVAKLMYVCYVIYRYL